MADPLTFGSAVCRYYPSGGGAGRAHVRAVRLAGRVEDVP